MNDRLDGVENRNFESLPYQYFNMPVKTSSVEHHLENTQKLISAAEMFVSGAEDAKTLATHAENFISTAENHISSAEAIISSSEKHLLNLKKTAGSAEDSVAHLSSFIGAEDKIPKKPKSAAKK